MKYILLFILSMAFAIWVWDDAYPAARGTIGPGTFIITTPDGETFGTANGSRVDTRKPPAEQFGTPENPATFRLQFENITPNPHAEPDCPRGVKVLRYGVRGC